MKAVFVPFLPRKFSKSQQPPCPFDKNPIPFFMGHMHFFVTNFGNLNFFHSNLFAPQNSRSPNSLANLFYRVQIIALSILFLSAFVLTFLVKTVIVFVDFIKRSKHRATFYLLFYVISFVVVVIVVVVFFFRCTN